MNTVLILSLQSPWSSVTQGPLTLWVLTVVRMVSFVVDDGFAQGYCGIDLSVRGVSGFQYFCLESVGFRRGRGEASEVHFDFRWSGSGGGTVLWSVPAYCSFEPREGALRVLVIGIGNGGGDIVIGVVPGKERLL